MRAIFFQEHGPISVLRYGQISDPVLSPGEALVKVKYCALNRLDIWVREGWKGLKINFPHITGSDVVGELIEINGHSKTLRVGDTVLINPGIITSYDEWVARGEPSVSPNYRILGEQFKGGLAEFVVVPIQNLLKVPEGRNILHIVATILTGITCWRMLFCRANVKPGESVLVVGAGGGVNSLAIQILKKIGCYVIVVAGGKEKMEKAYELGADVVFDYKKHKSWSVQVLETTRGRGVDLVVDNVGKATLNQSIFSVKRGGRIVTVGNTSGWDCSLDNRYIFAKQISLIGSTMGSEIDLIESQNFIHNNGIKPCIHDVYDLKDAIKALKMMEQGKHFGKILIRVT